MCTIHLYWNIQSAYKHSYVDPAKQTYEAILSMRCIHPSNNWTLIVLDNGLSLIRNKAICYDKVSLSPNKPKYDIQYDPNQCLMNVFYAIAMVVWTAVLKLFFKSAEYWFKTPLQINDSYSFIFLRVCIIYSYICYRINYSFPVERFILPSLSCLTSSLCSWPYFILSAHISHVNFGLPAEVAASLQ